MKGLKELKVVFYGVDDWDRPVFRDVYEQDGKYRYGTTFFADLKNLWNATKQALIACAISALALGVNLTAIALKSLVSN